MFVKLLLLLKYYKSSGSIYIYIYIYTFTKNPFPNFEDTTPFECKGQNLD